MAVYAVGDIQGCYRELRKLLEKVRFNPLTDKLWCTGDLVNRGPDSLETLRFLKWLGDSCICVLGNHDLHLLELVAGGKPYHRDTLIDVLEAPDCDELINWLRFRPMLHYDADLNWCMVHAGLHPHWSLKKARKRAAAIEQQLRGDGWQDFCSQLHHLRFPVAEPLKCDATRTLFSTAVFTRTRYCSQDGMFNWDVRAGISTNRKEKPWFRHKQLAWRDDCKVVYGHWAANGLVLDQSHVLGLDSGCVWGGKLTIAQLKRGGHYRIESGVSCRVAPRQTKAVIQPSLHAAGLSGEISGH